MRTRKHSAGIHAILLPGWCLVLAQCAAPVRLAAPTQAAPAPPAARVPIAPAQRFTEGAPIETFADANRKAELAAVFPRLDAQLAEQAAAQKLPGLALISATSSFMDFAEKSGLTEITLGEAATSVIGAKSFTGS